MGAAIGGGADVSASDAVERIGTAAGVGIDVATGAALDGLPAMPWST